jgi:NADH dehydrogenase
MAEKIVTIFGGSGFLGRYIVKELAPTGMFINIAERYPEEALFLKTAGFVGQINLIPANVTSKESIKQAIKNSDIVINTVGVLYSKGKQDFKKLHTEAAGNIARVAKELGCAKFIHVSALGIDKAYYASTYAKTKLEGEKEILKHFPQATIIRPSVIFGKEDNFLNKFAAMATILPFLPLINEGKTRLQPVYVRDVAEAIATIIKDEKKKYNGKIVELGGPEVYSFKEVIKFILKTINRKKLLLPLPEAVAKLIGVISEIFMPKPVITRDLIKLLNYDNVVGDKNKLKFSDLNITPQSMKHIIPTYLKILFGK